MLLIDSTHNDMTEAYFKMMSFMSMITVVIMTILQPGCVSCNYDELKLYYAIGERNEQDGFALEIINELHIPHEVLAMGYHRILKNPSLIEDNSLIFSLVSYGIAFLNGTVSDVSQNAPVPSSDLPMRSLGEYGYYDGIYYRRRYPHCIPSVLNAYGYRYVESKGILILRDGGAAFYPEGSSEDDDPWIVSFLPEFDRSLINDIDDYKKIKVRVHGYVSKPSEFYDSYYISGKCRFMLKKLLYEK